MNSIKQFFRYNQIGRLANGQFTFFKPFVLILIYQLILRQIMKSENTGVTMGISVLFVYAAAGYMLTTYNEKNDNYMTQMVPMSSSKRIGYRIWGVVLGFVIFIVFAIVIFFIISLLLKSDNTEIDESGYATMIYMLMTFFILAFSSFIVYLNSVKERKEFYIKVLVGGLSFYIYNIIIMSILSNKFVLKGNIHDLLVSSNNFNLYSIIFSIPYVIVVLTLFVITIKKSKPKYRELKEIELNS